VARTPILAMCSSTLYLLSKCGTPVCRLVGADRAEDEVYACGPGRVRGGDALSRLGLGASFEWRRHREEGGRSFERLRERGRVFE